MELIFIILLLIVSVMYVSSHCGQTCQDECLVFHNKYRQNHNVSLLKYDHELAAQAQLWANKGILESSPMAIEGIIGECWAWGNIFPSWKAVIKTWHDQEKNYDWENFKSINNEKVGCFQQIIWASATKIGCAKSYVDGYPMYVAQMDVPGVVNRYVSGHGKANIRKPLQNDLQWFNGDIDLLPGDIESCSVKQF